MRLKLHGNPTPTDGQVEFYKRAARIALESEVDAESGVGKIVLIALGDAYSAKGNATDAVMTTLAEIEAACRRIREEMRGIHS